MLKDNITELTLQQFPRIDACDSWCVICLTMQLLGSYISTIRGQHKYAKIKKKCSLHWWSMARIQKRSVE